MKTLNDNLRSTIAAASACAIMLCSGSVLLADEQRQYYTLTAFEDMNFGEEIIAGEYDAAIQGILSLGKHHRNAFEAQTNLCVAYTRSGDFENANASCDAALTALKKRSRASVAPGLAPYNARRVKEKYLAVALSNRGVLRAVNGEPELARKDFVEAATLRYSLDAAEVNLAKLGAEVPMKTAQQDIKKLQ